MTLTEMIAKSLPSRQWGNPEWKAIDQILAENGLVIVRIDDLRTYVLDEEPLFSDYVSAQARLRAALPERTGDVREPS